MFSALRSLVGSPPPDDKQAASVSSSTPTPTPSPTKENQHNLKASKSKSSTCSVAHDHEDENVAYAVQQVAGLTLNQSKHVLQSIENVNQLAASESKVRKTALFWLKRVGVQVKRMLT